MNYFNLVKKEEKRQRETINLIASENYVSKNVLKALGSVFTNKYAEGYPHKRYYAGNEVVDELEDAVKKDALSLFHLSPKKWDVNVQAYSGSVANLAVYFALVSKGAKIMAMDLNMGGHLTHGARVSITGQFWKQVPYGVDRKTERIDYGALLKLAKREKPALVIAGGSAYSRVIDFKKFRKIANAAGAFLMVDMAHFAGLVAGRAHPSPFPYADVVTTTTHKTLRGPRAALIFSRREPVSRFFARNASSGSLRLASNLSHRLPDARLGNEKQVFLNELIDKAVFPGIQGGPHMNAIASVGVALKEAQTPAFRRYAAQVVKNAKALAEELKKRGWRVISGGTDTHLFLVDVASRGLGGKEASEMLERVGIIANKNLIPYDPRKPVNPSGIRLGTPAVTTRGMKEREMELIAELISDTLLGKKPLKETKRKILSLTRKFPI